MHKHIFKSAAAISVMTALSRVTGFLRDILIAGIFGTGAAAQAFFVAFRIPNMFRDILGEGAGNAAFVPVFCEYLVKKSRDQFARLVNGLFRVVVFVSLLVAGVGMLLAGPLVHLIAPGFTADPGKLELTIRLTRLLFPYLALVAVSAYLMAVANSLKSFVVPASAPVVFNCILIAVLVFFVRRDGALGIIFLAFGVLLAGVGQVFVQLPGLVRQGVRIEWPGGARHWRQQEGILKVGRLIVPRIAGTSIYQLNVFVDTIFASLSAYVGDGAVAAVYYANRIIQLPFAIIGVALSNAALPQMASDSTRRDAGALNRTLHVCLKAVLLTMLPVSVGVLVFARPIIEAVYARGSFGYYSTSLTSVALFFYALGIVSYGAVRFLSHSFYALQDTLTPVRTSAAALGVNIVLNGLFIFVLRMGIAGLALASAFSAALNFWLLYRAIRRRTAFALGPDFGALAVKALSASAGCVGCAFVVWQNISLQRATLLDLSLVVLVASVSYAALLWALGVAEYRKLLRWLTRRR